MKKFNYAFTLAEILMVLVILGIVATIVIPTTMKRSIKKTNITKLKKAMAAYETIVEKVIIEEGVQRSINEINNWAITDQNNSCENVKKYFNIMENGDNSCQFKTSDGVWWDFNSEGKFSKPVVALKRENLNIADARDCSNFNAFFMFSSFDSNGSVRVNDLAYEKEKSQYNENYLNKLYDFVQLNKSNRECRAIYELTPKAQEWLSQDYSQCKSFNDNETLAGCNAVREGEEKSLGVISGTLYIEEGAKGTQNGVRSGWVVNKGTYVCNASQSGWVINFGTYIIEEGCNSSLLYNYGEVQNPHNKNINFYENTGVVNN